MLVVVVEVVVVDVVVVAVVVVGVAVVVVVVVVVVATVVDVLVPHPPAKQNYRRNKLQQTRLMAITATTGNDRD